MKKTIYTKTVVVILIALAASPIFAQRNDIRWTTEARESVLNAPGDLDATWGSGGIVTASYNYYHRAYDLHVQPDGKVIVSGIAETLIGASGEYFIARFNANGTPDTSFGTGGKISEPYFTNGEYYRISALQPDGKILFGGCKRIDDAYYYLLTRYNADGTRDATFGSGGKVVTRIGIVEDRVTDLLVQPDGKIVAVGFSRETNYQLVLSAVRYHANGTLDSSFGTGGRLLTQVMLNLIRPPVASLQPDGKIVVVGTARYATEGDYQLVRLLPNGQFDTSFGTNGKLVTDLSGTGYPLDIALQPDGKIIVSGTMNVGYQANDTAIVRYNANGSLDAGFASNGILGIPSGSGYFVGASIAAQPNGKIITVGEARANMNGTAYKIAVARFNADGSPDAAFGTGGKVFTQIGEDEFSYAEVVALRPNGRIIVAGSTQRIYNNSPTNLAIVSYLSDAAAPQPTRFDFDGDGKADQAVFRPSDRVWYLLRSASGFTAAQFGISTDKITPADFDGDGRADIAVFRDGVWYWLASSNGSFNAYQFGLSGDIPVPADYTGDGRAELAVYRGGVWYLLNLTNNQFQAIQFGISTDKPVPADFDGDGKTDVAVYRDGVWYWLRSSDNGFRAVQFGIASDKPTVGDYDGDSKADQAVYRSGVWYILGSTQGFSGVQFGIASDIPAAADYDGDGKTDVAVFRDGVWYMLRSQQGFGAVQFGTTNDKPIPAAYVP